MRIGPTAAGQHTQAPFRWGMAERYPASEAVTLEEFAALKVGATHASQAAQPSLRKRSLSAISA